MVKIFTTFIVVITLVSWGYSKEICTKDATCMLAPYHICVDENNIEIRDSINHQMLADGNGIEDDPNWIGT